MFCVWNFGFGFRGQDAKLMGLLLCGIFWSVCGGGGLGLFKFSQKNSTKNINGTWKPVSGVILISNMKTLLRS